MSRKRWNLLPRIPGDALAALAGCPPLVAQLAYNRGLTSLAELERFIARDRRLVADPLLLPDMSRAISRLYRALLSGETIAIYGDFDADGITSTAVLVEGLARLGGRTIYYIPSRLGEGHGLRARALQELRDAGASLVVTVDCGITGVAEAERARRLGMDLVITDHHTPPDELPRALALVNPKLPGSSYPFTGLAGVGVAYKLLEALFCSLGRESFLEEMLDLVALGTVADMSPLLSENRYLVAEGLKRLNSHPRPGLREMMAQAGLREGSIDAEVIAWVIAPRLNTASRMDHALPSYELLTTSSPAEAQRLAAWLEKKNAERQALTTRAVARARQQILAGGIQPILVVADEHYPAGIAGLVAGRLAEEFYRPVVVVGVGRSTSSGSCRSIPEFDIIRALNRCRHLFNRFGGHSQAAGFVIKTRLLPELREHLLAMAEEELAGVDLRPRLDIDAEVRLVELGGPTYRAIQQLAPFGQANPLPAFLTRGVTLVDCRTMGSNGDHLRCRVSQDGVVWEAVGFGMGSALPKVGEPLDIVYHLEADQWEGRSTLRLNLLDFAPAGTVDTAQ